MKLKSVLILASLACIGVSSPSYADYMNINSPPGIIRISSQQEIPKINLNRAVAKDFEALKGIGPKKAQAIVDYRAKSGHFKSIDDLSNVKGINQKLVAKLKNEVTL